MFKIATVFTIAFVLANAEAAERTPIDAASAANIARNCFACHDDRGQGAGAIPALRGMDAQIIADALKKFRSGERDSTMMGRHAKAYSDAQIDAVAAYISKIK